MVRVRRQGELIHLHYHLYSTQTRWCILGPESGKKSLSFHNCCFAAGSLQVKICVQIWRTTEKWTEKEALHKRKNPTSNIIELYQCTNFTTMQIYTKFISCINDNVSLQPKLSSIFYYLTSIEH